MKNKFLKRSLSLLIAFVTSLSIVSCKSVGTPPDVPAFLPLDENRAYYVYTISDKEGWVDNDQALFYDANFVESPKKWAEIKAKAIILPSFSWGPLNAYIAKICEKEQKECRKNGNPMIKIQKLKQVNEMSEQLDSQKGE